jgi:hypothetical protein
VARSPRIDAALERGRDDARRGASAIVTGPDGRPRVRRVAIGDPQAPFEKFLAILDRHRLLGDDGRLDPDVQLVSMGDHFDWGHRADRDKAADSALSLIAWLAAHPSDQVILIAGNHDLARVGELARYDDDAFAPARAEADVVYADGEPDALLEARFLKHHPDAPTAETFARDFATFRVEQRTFVIETLRSKRMKLAHAVAADFLLLHAGITDDELAAIGVPPSARADAPAIADALNASLDAALARFDGTAPLDIPLLHRPGDSVYGEARGILFHRASNPAHEGAALFAGPPRRRYDPRRLPRGLTQAIGHIRDNKSRRLLAGWADAALPADGVLRHLTTDGETVRYRHGTPPSSPSRARDAQVATMLFTDGSMSSATLESYEMLDLDTRAAFVPVTDDVGSPR